VPAFAGTGAAVAVQFRPDPDADYLAALLTATPSLRAQFFGNPIRAIGKALPPPKYWNYTDGSSMLFPWFWYQPLRYHKARRRLAKEVFDKVAAQVENQTLSSSINTDSVFDEFFSPAVRLSQRSYTSVYLLSWAAFFIGVALIGVGTYVGVAPAQGRQWDDCGQHLRRRRSGKRRGVGARHGSEQHSSGNLGSRTSPRGADGVRHAARPAPGSVRGELHQHDAAHARLGRRSQ